MRSTACVDSAGRRRGELLALRWEWIDTESGEIRLPETNNGEGRVIPIAGELVRIMERLAKGRIQALRHEENEHRPSARRGSLGRGSDGLLGTQDVVHVAALPGEDLGLCYEQKRMEKEALAEIQEAVRLSGGDDPLFLATLGRIQATFGRRAEAERTLALLGEIGASRYVSSYHVAAIAAALGDADRAFALLDRAVEERSHALTFLLVDPGVDPLRADHRFADVVRRVGFPAERR